MSNLLMQTLVSLSLTALLQPAIAADANAIKAPARSEAATRIAITPGEPTKDIARAKHGRHHPGHIKKDVTRDDTIPAGDIDDKPKKDPSDKNSSTDPTRELERNS